MDNPTTTEEYREMSSASIAIYSQVMIEKWLLVLLIVGCTSLVFLICFPIDFWLYRRRKRLARERNKVTLYVGTGTRNVNNKGDASEGRHWQRRIHGFRAQKGLARFLSFIKKTPSEDLVEYNRHLTESRSENSTDIQLMTSFVTCNSEIAQDSSIFGPFGPQTEQKGRLKSINERNSTEHIPGRLSPLSPLKSNQNQNVFPERKLSNVSAAWSENETLVDSEMKYMNYESLKTRSSCDLVNETAERKCYTIHVRSRNLSASGPETDETNTDILDIRHETARDNNAAHALPGQADDKNETLPNGGTENVHDNRGKMNSSIKHLEAVGIENNDNDKNFDLTDTKRKRKSKSRKKKRLKHSMSQQCIQESVNQQNLFECVNVKKRNIVSPYSLPTLYPLQCDTIQNNYGESVKQRSFSLSLLTASEEKIPKPKSRKKWRKKSLLRTQSSLSMPDLQNP